MAFVLLEHSSRCVAPSLLAIKRNIQVLILLLHILTRTFLENNLLSDHPRLGLPFVVLLFVLLDDGYSWSTEGVVVNIVASITILPLPLDIDSINSITLIHHDDQILLPHLALVKRNLRTGTSILFIPQLPMPMIFMIHILIHLREDKCTTFLVFRFRKLGEFKGGGGGIVAYDFVGPLEVYFRRGGIGGCLFGQHGRGETSTKVRERQ
mmetsp:Transcript_5611/g.12461  ORF Transcript_5611/g.12461 Transcript_5611/m.12461 type:complete len:209 (+) Transcript_5611:715-1341(+)